MKNIMEDEMIIAYQLLLKRITETGVCIPKTRILDNEASAGHRFSKMISLFDNCWIFTLRLALFPTKFSCGDGIKMIWGEDRGEGWGGREGWGGQGA